MSDNIPRSYKYLEIGVLAFSAVTLAITITNAIFYYDISESPTIQLNNGTITQSQAQVMMWLNIILAVFALIIFILSIVMLFRHSSSSSSSCMVEEDYVSEDDVCGIPMKPIPTTNINVAKREKVNLDKSICFIRKNDNGDEEWDCSEPQPTTKQEQQALATTKRVIAAKQQGIPIPVTEKPMIVQTTAEVYQPVANPKLSIIPE